MIKDKEILDKLVEKHYNYLCSIIEYNIKNKCLRNICKQVVNNQLFLKSPAAKKCHQAYPGGLVVHTSEVLEISLRMAESSNLIVDTDVLITGCIFHDYGKIWDYKVKEINTELMGDHYTENLTEYDDSAHRKYIYHLPRSYSEFNILVREYRPLDDLPEHDLIDKISHCILSHHGRLEWGSPIEPQTTEAFIIHFADMLSSRCSINK